MRANTVSVHFSYNAAGTAFLPSLLGVSVSFDVVISGERFTYYFVR